MNSSFNDVPAFGLLHVADDVQHPVNLGRSVRSPIDIYLQCAALCAQSFAAQGMTFTLISNAPDTLRARALHLGLPDFAIVGHAFHWRIPAGLRFHSAHYKLELIEAIGQGRFGAAALLVDIDTVLLKPFALPPLPVCGLLAYDIGHEIFVHADWPVRRDLEMVAGRSIAAPCWWGGEFLAGTSEGFARLAATISTHWDRYLECAKSLHHVGDEMLVSVALNILADDGFTILDAGRAGGVLRWWSARTTFSQPRLRTVADRSLWHLPADKPFLADQLNRPFEPKRFQAHYRRHMVLKGLPRRLYSLLDRLRGRRPKLIARW
jgi:hypothetical protein